MNRYSVVGQGSSWAVADDVAEVMVPGMDYCNRLSAEEACRCMNDAEEAFLNMGREMSI